MVSFNITPVIISLFDNFIIRIIFQIYSFIEVIDRLYLYEIFYEVDLIIKYIHDNYSQFEIIITLIRIFKRSFAELSNFPFI